MNKTGVGRRLQSMEAGVPPSVDPGAWHNYHAPIMKHLVMICALALAMPGCASPNSPSSPQGGSDEVGSYVENLLRSMSRTLADAKSVRFQIEETIDRVHDSGAIASYTSLYSVRARKPDRLHATDETNGYHMLFNGSQLVMFDARDSRYARVDAPNSLEEMFDFAIDEFDITLPLAELLSNDPFSAIMNDVDRGRYVGIHAAGGKPCYHLAFQQEEIDWQIWIQRDAPMVPRRIVILHKRLPMKPRFTATLSNWDLKASFKDDLFEFSQTSGPKEMPMVELLQTWESLR